jgi:hypothetical protein
VLAAVPIFFCVYGAIAVLVLLRFGISRARSFWRAAREKLRLAPRGAHAEGDRSQIL